MRFKYVLSEVMVGLWRNVTMTIAMIITMAVSLTLLGASLLRYKQVDRMKEVYNEEVEVSMFFSAEGATPEGLPIERSSAASFPEGCLSRRMDEDLRGRVLRQQEPAVEIEEEIVLQALRDQDIDRFCRVRTGPFALLR